MNDTETSSPPGPTGAAAPLSLRGIGLWPGFLGAREQVALMAKVAAIWDAAPPVRPVTRWGKPLSVAMTSAGSLGPPTGAVIATNPRSRTGAPGRRSRRCCWRCGTG